MAGEEEDYFAEFDRRTRKGQVLRQDLSVPEILPPRQLLDVEKTARVEWNGARYALEEYYANRDREIDTVNKFLEERIVPPPFTTKSASTRNLAASRKPRNPTEIFEWEHFDVGVRSFSPTDGDAGLSARDARQLKAFKLSFATGASVYNEEGETIFHINSVLFRLRTAGLLDYDDSQEVRRHGLPDFMLSEADGDGVHESRIVLEYKATHNLPLPMKANDVVRRYANGCPGLSQDRNKQQQRDKERVCDTLGQLFRYMAANGLRYGALTSATRTYFCFFDNEEGVANKVYVSNAWFIGQEHYLRAWAYLWSLSTRAETYNSEDVKWNFNDAEYDPGDDQDGNDDDDFCGDDDQGGDDSELGAPGGPKRRRNRNRNRDGSGEAPTNKISRSDMCSVNIPSVSFRSITFLDALGYGRNGCVFRAKWDGKNVAVKQFDVGVPGVTEMFQNEIRGYDLLRDAQGVLIPKALFLAESNAGIKYFGLQLGREPMVGDDISGWPKVLEALETEYGFRHKDCEHRNCLIITDSGGKERLVAIDLEDYRLTQRASLSRTQISEVPT